MVESTTTSQSLSDTELEKIFQAEKTQWVERLLARVLLSVRTALKISDKKPLPDELSSKIRKWYNDIITPKTIELPVGELRPSVRPILLKRNKI